MSHTVTARIERDRNGFITAVVDPNGRRIVAVRDRHGFISSLEGPEPAAPERDPLLRQAVEIIAKLDERIAGLEQQAARTANEAARQPPAAQGEMVKAGALVVSEPMIAEAISELGLICPVYVEWFAPGDPELGHAGGLYEFNNDLQRHVLRIRLGMSVEQTANAIAHELMHCKQAETLQERWGQEYVTRKAELEAQARDGAERLTARLELVKAAA